MDLSNPMMSDKDKEYVDDFVTNYQLEFHPEEFVQMCEEDQIGNLIRNTDFWVRDVFKGFVENK